MQFSFICPMDRILSGASTPSQSGPGIECNISIDFIYIQLNVKTVLFPAFQFSISMQFSFIWPIDSSGPGSEGNKEVIRI